MWHRNTELWAKRGMVRSCCPHSALSPGLSRGQAAPPKPDLLIPYMEFLKGCFKAILTTPLFSFGSDFEMTSQVRSVLENSILRTLQSPAHQQSSAIILIHQVHSRLLPSTWKSQAGAASSDVGWLLMHNLGYRRESGSVVSWRDVSLPAAPADSSTL